MLSERSQTDTDTYPMISFIYETLEKEKNTLVDIRQTACYL